MSVRRRTMMPIKGYYTRAKVFLVLMLVILTFYFLYQFYLSFAN